MTLVIGVRCNDGLVMAADSMATEAAPQGAGLLTRHETDQKIQIQRDLLWGSSGSIGVRQIVEHIINDNYDYIYNSAWAPVFIRYRIVEKISPLVTEQYKITAEASLGKGPIPHTNFIFGIYSQAGFHFLNIECDMQGEVVLARHCATGSGAKSGQALLRRLRNQDWDLRTGEVVAYRTMNDAIHVEPSGIGPPIQLARYYLDGDNKPKIEMIAGEDYNRIRDTAMAWTDLEQEVLSGLNHSQAAESPAADAPPEPKPVPNMHKT